jgi:hypothetical protein
MDETIEQYRRAYEVAPPQVKAVIEEFLKKPKKFRENVPLLYYLLGSGTMAYKMSKEVADYVDQSRIKTQNCKNCIFGFQNLVTKKAVCSQMRGFVRYEGWCKLWKSGHEK